MFFDIVRKNARVVKQVDTKDLKSFGQKCPCRFESGPEYKCNDLEISDGTDAMYEMETFETRIKE